MRQKQSDQKIDHKDEANKVVRNIKRQTRRNSVLIASPSIQAALAQTREKVMTLQVPVSVLSKKGTEIAFLLAFLPCAVRGLIINARRKIIDDLHSSQLRHNIYRLIIFF